MSEQVGDTRAVFCNAEKLILPHHLQALRDAVDRVHRATILSLLLLNLHIFEVFGALRRGGGRQHFEVFGALRRGGGEVAVQEVEREVPPPLS